MPNQKYQIITSESDLSSEATMAAVHSNSNIPSTHSSQQLMTDGESVSGDIEEVEKSPNRRNRSHSERLGLGSVTSKEWFTVAVLCFINLINYMDRFTIAGKCL